mmetsp:Transcript_14867/g.41069  ORF Transcript_14867/g.41069 Transcript_14867/m.41069 type:complete len:446 (-) Transcript_14867:619-1956(-)
MSSSTRSHPNFITQLSERTESFLKVELPDYAAAQTQLTWILTLLALSSLGLLILLSRRRRRNDSTHVLVTTARTVQYGSLVAALVLAVLSPWNHTDRTVYQAPLLTESEAQELLHRAAAVAYQNYASVVSRNRTGPNNNQDPSGFLQEPLGWHKTRREAYLTTDLKLATDPFTAHDRAWLADKLDARLAPLLSRLYGISQASIRCNDLFLVRYQAGKRARLRKHVDDVDLSFNLLLSTNFTGGGTRFFNGWQQKLNNPAPENDHEFVFYHAQPRRAGTVLLHSSQVEHEGHQVDTGTRFILAGFLSVDRVNPLTSTSNRLSLFASWFHAQWVQIRLRAAHQQAKAEQKHSRSILTLWWSTLTAGAGALLLFLIEALSQHQAVELVSADHANEFIAALDEEYQNGNQPQQQRASWYRGQQLQLQMDGSVWRVWDTRRENEELFQEL